MTKIQIAAANLIKRYGSLRKAEAATGINYEYLRRLASSERTQPTDAVLKALGFTRRVTYRKTNGSVP